MASLICRWALNSIRGLYILDANAIQIAQQSYWTSFCYSCFFFCILIPNTIVFKLLGSWVLFCWVTLSTIYKCLFDASLSLKIDKYSYNQMLWEFVTNFFLVSFDKPKELLSLKALKNHEESFIWIFINHPIS